MNFLSLTQWGMGFSEPFLIPGPCSIENEIQVFDTILNLPPSGVQLVRGGIWKPRTRPNSFEGVGNIGLAWLKQAGLAINRPVTTEVANAKHVYEALMANIDVLWIGARTTVNPFAVQDIADALQGVDIPILVKNPVNPDLALWMGAIERLHQAGIFRIAAIHRGFSYYGESKYRNKPLWELPIALRQAWPSLPLICDPSHICGNRQNLAEVAQKALDLGYNGLMLEAHTNPAKALSDAQQQLTPDALTQLIAGLVQRSPASSANPNHQTQLTDFRQEIDQLDKNLVETLARRMEIVREIGKLKKIHKLQILDAERWQYILNSRTKLAAENHLSDAFMISICNAIHNESIRQQTKIMND